MVGSDEVEGHTEEGEGKGHVGRRRLKQGMDGGGRKESRWSSAPQVVCLKNDVQKEGAMEGDGEMAGKG